LAKFRAAIKANISLGLGLEIVRTRDRVSDRGVSKVTKQCNFLKSSSRTTTFASVRAAIIAKISLKVGLGLGYRDQDNFKIL
jgi:hypothetical protein